MFPGICCLKQKDIEACEKVKSILRKQFVADGFRKDLATEYTILVVLFFFSLKYICNQKFRLLISKNMAVSIVKEKNVVFKNSNFLKELIPAD